MCTVLFTLPWVRENLPTGYSVRHFWMVLGGGPTHPSHLVRGVAIALESQTTVCLLTFWNNTQVDLTSELFLLVWFFAYSCSLLLGRGIWGFGSWDEVYMAHTSAFLKFPDLNGLLKESIYQTIGFLTFVYFVTYFIYLSVAIKRS